MDFNQDTGTIDNGVSFINPTTTPPLGAVAGVLTISGTGSLALPSGTTGQEPSAVVAGQIRWNTTVPQLEYSNGSVWLSFTAGTGSVTSVQISLASTGLTFTNSGGATPAGAGQTSGTITTSGVMTLTGTLAAVNGGTGQNTYTTGDILFASSSTALSKLAVGSSTQVLHGGATPSYGAVSLTADVSGILPIANGGTNSTTVGAAGTVAYSDGTGIVYTAAGTTNQLLQSNAAGTPTWTSAPTIGGGNITASSINNSALVNSSITIGTTNIALGATSLTLDGVTSLTLTGSNSNVTGVGTPINSSDAVPLSYLQNVLGGLEWKAEAQAGSTAALTVIYANGASGVGATLTNAGAQAAFVIDGFTTVVGDRILIKDQASGFQNGIYQVTSVGSGATNWVLTRVVDADGSTDLNNATLYVTNGTVNGGAAYSQTTKNPTVGTSNIVFVQTAGCGGNAVTSFQTSLSGLTPSIATTGAVTLAGTLNVASGGTGVTSLTSNGVLFGGTTVGATAAGTTGQVLIGNTAAAPSFAALSGLAVTSITGTANQITASASTGAVTLSTPSAFIAPGSVQVTTYLQRSATAAVSAAGATQGAATVLTTDENFVTTVAAGTGVQLPAALLGKTITVINKGANPLLVYPATGAAIDGLAVNLPVTVPVGQSLIVDGASATQWYSSSPALTGGTGITVTTVNGVTTFANSGVLSFSAGTTGFTPNTATTGVVTLAGILSLANGGTNANLTAVAGGVVYSTASAMAITAAGTSGFFLTSAGAGTPTWSNPATTVVQSFQTSLSGLTPSVATTGVVTLAGTLNVASGGTGATTLGAGGVLFGNGTTAVGSVVGTSGQVLTSGGAGTPVWKNTTGSGGILQLYVENPSAPTTPLAAGTNAVAIGSGSSAGANTSFAVGDGTSTYIAGAKAFANGKFATAGDAQTGMYVLRNSTTNATGTDLFVDGAAVRLVPPNNSVWTFVIYVTARRTDATGGGAGYKFEGAVRKDATSASIVFIGTPSKTVLGETNAAWDAVLTANTTNGDLRVTATGEATKTIRWVSTVLTTEVTN